MEDGKLGKYEIKGTLGKGAMGTVYEGWDPIIRRKVAIKTVRLPDPSDTEAQEEIARFRIEAQAGGRLNHPNICGIFDYGETDEVAYIVMEYIDGRTLKSSLDKEERFPVAETVRIMEGLLAGLQFSHDRQVVHRDIKPANVMLTTDGTVKIADFGIARIEQGHLTQAGAVLGTPAYMSPEQFMGNPVDSRTDLYSSGVVLYQLLTGERPFEGGFSAIMHKALNTEPLRPSELSVMVPTGFDTVVAKAMAKRPAERYATALEFAHAVRAALDAPAAVPPPPPPSEPDWGDATINSSTLTATRLPGGRPGGADGLMTMATPGRDTPGLATTAPDPLATLAPALDASGPVPPPVPAPPVPAPAPNRLPVYIGAGVLVLAVAGTGGWFMTRGGTPTPVQRTSVETLVAGKEVPPAAATAAGPPMAHPPEVTSAAPSQVATASSAPTATAPSAPVPSAPPIVPPTPTAPPVVTAMTPPPPEPPPPPPVAALAAAFAAIPCTLVGGDVTQPDNSLLLTGLAHTGQPEMAVRKVLTDLAPNASTDWHITSFDGPYCRALDVLRPLAPHFAQPTSGFTLALAGDRTTLRDSDLITLHLTTPDFPAYLTVDYLQHDGSTFHMHPTGTDPSHLYPAGTRQSLGDPTAGGARWEVSEPYGTEIITAIATSVPLFSKPRPDSETNDAYLKDLQTAIDAAKKKGARFAVGAVILKTEPKPRQ